MENVLEVQQVDKGIYWKPDKLLSYNRLLNFVVGERGVGKTYAMKMYLIKRFLKYGEQFIYLRRYKSHLRGGVVLNFFDKVAKEFPGVKFAVKGNVFMINGKVAGYAIPLSAWQTNKGTEYPDVNTIFYDEFLKEKDNSHYLDNEPQALLSMAESVFRDKIIFGTENVRIVCCANSTTMANPFFIYFKVFPDINKRINTFNHNKELIVEITDQSEFVEQKEQGRLGQLIKGTQYEGVSLKNDFSYDKQDFIGKRSKESKFKFSVSLDGFTFGIWVDVKKTIMYMSTKYDGGTYNQYALSKNDYTENRILASNYKEYYELLRMISAFKNGQLRFENQTVRNVAYDMFSRMGVK